MLCVILGGSQFRVQKDESNLKAPFTRGFASFGRRWPGLSLANPEIIPRFGLSRSLALPCAPVLPTKKPRRLFLRRLVPRRLSLAFARTTDFNAIPHTTIQRSHSPPFSFLPSPSFTPTRPSRTKPHSRLASSPIIHFNREDYSFHSPRGTITLKRGLYRISLTLCGGRGSITKFLASQRERCAGIVFLVGRPSRDGARYSC